MTTIDLVPVTVHAHLTTGVALPPWGISLDGLLASQLHDPHHRARDTPDPPDLPLPLGRCHLDPDHWHWAATCSYPDRRDIADTHVWTSHRDHRTLETTAPCLPRTISPRQGRYRDHHMPLVITVASTLTWRAVADPDALTTLLTPVGWIGKKRAHGEGQVARWQIHPEPDMDPFEAGHLHPDRSLGRPCPTACRDHADLDSPTGTAGLRPPYMHPGRQHTLALPAVVSA